MSFKISFAVPQEVITDEVDGLVKMLQAVLNKLGEAFNEIAPEISLKDGAFVVEQAAAKATQVSSGKLSAAELAWNALKARL